MIGVQGELAVPDFETELDALDAINAKLDNDIVWSLSARLGGIGLDLKMKPVTHTGMVGIAYNFGSLF